MCAAFPTPLLALLLALTLLLRTADAQFVGGWSPANVTESTTALLKRALINESSYRADVTARVCVFEIRSLSQQVVSGMNYRFEVQACKVSSAAKAGVCSGKALTTNASVCDEYAIQLYEEVWTSTLEVTSIELLSASPSSSPSPSASGGVSSAKSPSPSSSTGPISSDSVARDTDVAKTPSPSPTPQSAAHLRSSNVVAALMSSVALALAV
ncbi:hypothetical protein PybrP1_012396 [[Pythium] brassicae (nom. inval.)]|nr:hypothetical protein PybrP1_012396 [[Pythium] brassicae (nom. inval.)]